MTVPAVAERLERPLAWAIGAVLSVGLLGALVVEPVPSAREARRPAATAGGPGDGSGSEPGAPATDASGEAAVGAGGDGQPAAPTPAATVPEEPLGVSAVPAPGVYRYEVQTTDEAGESVLQEELREVTAISGDRASGTIELSARLAGEDQVSVIDWSPTGALVRSTRIETPGGPSQDCSWDPPFAELGALGEGQTWTLDSTCRATVAGVGTSFRVTGSGQVVGSATVAFGGGEVRVWQIRRDRTTVIEAEVGGTNRRQVAREAGTLFFDPGRGVVIRSDVTVTLTGPREGVTRRVSVLQP